MTSSWRLISRRVSIGISIAALVAAIVLYFIQRQWNLYMQLSLGLIVIGLAAFVALDPGAVRSAFTGRQARYGSNAFVLLAAFLGILIVINYVAFKNPKRWDLTADQSNTLAKETINVLKKLPGTVMAKAFFTSNADSSSQKDSAKSLLDKYVYEAGGKFKYEFIDPNKDPVASQDAGVTKDGTIFLYMGDTKQPVSSVSETDLTGALVKLMNPGSHVIYFLTGHGEYPLTGGDSKSFTELKTSLESKNYTVSDLNLLAKLQVPKDASVVVVAGPKKPLTADEVGMLDTYLKNGGSVVVMEDPAVDTQFGDTPDPLATDLTQNYGITLDNDVVVDLYAYQAVQNPYLALSYQYPSHAITQNMSTMYTGYQYARSISVNDGAGTDYTKSKLVLTYDQSWGETDLTSLQSPVYDKGVDIAGPVTLAVAAEASSTKARLVVIGDSDFATNAYYGFYGNSDMIVNSIDWAVKEENLISLTPKETVSRSLVQPKAYTMGLIFLGSIILLPGLVVVAGVSSWLVRRKQG